VGRLPFFGRSSAVRIFVLRVGRYFSAALRWRTCVRSSWRHATTSVRSVPLLPWRRWWCACRKEGVVARLVRPAGPSSGSVRGRVARGAAGVLLPFASLLFVACAPIRRGWAGVLGRSPCRRVRSAPARAGRRPALLVVITLNGKKGRKAKRAKGSRAGRPKKKPRKRANASGPTR